MRATIMALLVASTVAEARPRVAQNADADHQDEDNENDGDGPEAQAVLPIKLAPKIAVVRSSFRVFMILSLLVQLTAQ